MSCSTGNSNQDFQVGTYASGVSVHDPSVIQAESGDFYIFGSHMDTAVSSDLHSWTQLTSGVTANNPLFTGLFDNEKPAFTYVGKNDQSWYSVWAPDVIYNKTMGQYVMYFCTTSSYIKSTICYATADTIEGPYEYQGTIIYSGFTSRTYQETNLLDYVTEEYIRKAYLRGTVYNNHQWPNAIDPAVFYDRDGRMWLTYGSWSGGMFILELDEATGLPIRPDAAVGTGDALEKAAIAKTSTITDSVNWTDPYFGTHLVGGLHNSIEAPYILAPENSEYYYLFVSYGSLTTEGGYQIRLYRSENPDGPYVDTLGQQCGAEVFHNEFGLKMMGNYSFPSLSKAYMAPGHNSAIETGEGKLFLVFHTRFDDGEEFHEPRAHQLFVNRADWLVTAPFVYSGESLAVEGEGFSPKDIWGTYYLLNHGLAIGSTAQEAELVTLTKKGTITDSLGDTIGEWELEKGSVYITIGMDGVHYEGVVVEQSDDVGNPVLAITAVGDNNQTLWTVKYLAP